jgi:hypothetical protein
LISFLPEVRALIYVSGAPGKCELAALRRNAAIRLRRSV